MSTARPTSSMYYQPVGYPTTNIVKKKKKYRKNDKLLFLWKVSINTRSGLQ